MTTNDLLDLVRAPLGVTMLVTLGALVAAFLVLFAGCWLHEARRR